MIPIRVNTLWKGMVGVRDRYVKEAKETEQGLMIVHGQERMTIPHDEIEKRMLGQSEKRFKDKFNREAPGYLIYFNWKPEAKQVRLSL